MTALALGIRVIDREQLRSKVPYSSTHIYRLSVRGSSLNVFGSAQIAWTGSRLLDACIAEKALERCV